MRKEKANKQERKKAEDEERNALFGEALLAVKKKTTINIKGSKLDAQGRDGGDEEKKEKAGQSRAMKMMHQLDAQEVAEKMADDPDYVETIEDAIEKQRQKKMEELKASGIVGTPVTAVTLAAWQDRKRKRKEVGASGVRGGGGGGRQIT